MALRREIEEREYANSQNGTSRRMEPKVKVTVEGLPELLRHTAQDLQTIIDKRTELVILIDDLWLLLDQIKAALPDNTLVYDLRVDVRTDGAHLDNMMLEDAENILDELRHIHGWGMGQ